MNIIGRLTRDAQVRTLSNGKQLVIFSVAVNDSYRNKQGERVEQTTYFDCADWRTTRLAPFLTKGTLIELMGRVYASAWTGKNGAPKAGLNFHISNIKFHGGSRKSGAFQVADQSEKHKVSEQIIEDDLPF